MSYNRTYSEELKLVVSVLKKRFNNLSAEELIDLATQILDALASPGASIK